MRPTKNKTKVYVLNQSNSCWRWRQARLPNELPAKILSVHHYVMSLANEPAFIIDPSIEQFAVQGQHVLLL